MFRPRNTLVSVVLCPKQEDQIGLITVPTAHNEYAEAEIVEVGPGTVSAEGGISETADLQPGQRVWVKSKGKRPSPNGPILIDEGLHFRDGDRDLYLFEQSSIVAILRNAYPDPVNGDKNNE